MSRWDNEIGLTDNQRNTLDGLDKLIAELKAENTALHLFLDAICQAASDDPEHTLPALALPSRLRMLNKRYDDMLAERADLGRMIEDACFAFDGGQRNGETTNERLDALVAAARGGKLLAEQAAGMKVSPAEAAKFFHGLTEKLS